MRKVRKTSVESFIKKNIGKWYKDNSQGPYTICFEESFLNNMYYDDLVNDWVIYDDGIDILYYHCGYSNWEQTENVEHVESLNNLRGPLKDWYKNVKFDMQLMREKTEKALCVNLFNGKVINNRSKDYKLRVAKQNGWNI